jgi:hypothetical protein
MVWVNKLEAVVRLSHSSSASRNIFVPADRPGTTRKPSSAGNLREKKKRRGDWQSPVSSCLVTRGGSTLTSPQIRLQSVFFTLSQDASRDSKANLIRLSCSVDGLIMLVTVSSIPVRVTRIGAR